MHSCCLKTMKGICRNSRMLNPFQIYPSALKSIIRHLGVSHLPRTHCLVVLVGRFISEHHSHMLIENGRKYRVGRAQPVDLSSQS